jgi:hypothetical protein
VNGVPTAHIADSVTGKRFIALQPHRNSRLNVPHGDYQIRYRNIRIKNENIEPFPSNYVHFPDLERNKYTAFTEPQNALINKSQIPLIFSAASKNLHESIKICRLMGGMGDW